MRVILTDKGQDFRKELHTETAQDKRIEAEKKFQQTLNRGSS
jgi:hypothetical protein